MSSAQHRGSQRGAQQHAARANSEQGCTRRITAVTAYALRFGQVGSKPVRQTRCIEAGVSRNERGYGQLRRERFGECKIHRWAWVKFFGPIPKGLLVCHKCDNPICINPDHLELGTISDNAVDSVRRGRHAHARKTCCPRCGGTYRITGTRGARHCANKCRPVSLSGLQSRDCKRCDRRHRMTLAELRLHESQGG